MAWLGPIQDGRQPQRWRHKKLNFKAVFPHPLFTLRCIEGINLSFGRPSKT